MKQTKGRLTRDGAEVRRVQVMLDDATIERAKMLGDGDARSASSMLASLGSRTLKSAGSSSPELSRAAEAHERAATFPASASMNC